jgi:hypothetical protein
MFLCHKHTAAAETRRDSFNSPLIKRNVTGLLARSAALLSRGSDKIKDTMY